MLIQEQRRFYLRDKKRTVVRIDVADLKLTEVFKFVSLFRKVRLKVLGA